jgi:hypothetical protein
MEDFTARTYGTSGLDNRPLFGETSAKVSEDFGPRPRSGCVSVCLSVCLSALPGCSKAPGGTWRWKKLFLQPAPPLVVYPATWSPAFRQGWPKSFEGWGGEKFRKFLAVCWKSFSGVGLMWL